MSSSKISWRSRTMPATTLMPSTAMTSPMSWKMPKLITCSISASRAERAVGKTRGYGKCRRVRPQHAVVQRDRDRCRQRDRTADCKRSRSAESFRHEASEYRAKRRRSREPGHVDAHHTPTHMLWRGRLDNRVRHGICARHRETHNWEKHEGATNRKTRA